MSRAGGPCFLGLVASWIGLDFAVAAPPLPPPDALARAIEYSPEVRAAQARAVEAGHAATLSSLGPYDWLLSADAARRTIDGEGRFGEWNTALTRPVRLPGKAALDRQFGERQVEQAAAELGLAQRSARFALLDAWFNCLRSRERSRILDEDREFVSAIAASVATRRRAGDLAELDEALAVADRATVEADAITARIEAINAARLLALRMEGVSCEIADWDAPSPEAAPAAQGVERAAQILADPVVLASAAAAEQARIAADRARKDLRPDPTLGVTYGRERDGGERIGGVTISIPIGARRRSAEVARAAAAAAAAAADLAAARADAERQWLQRDSERRRAHEVWRALADAERRQERAADLSLRAFELGETSYSESLVVRRAALQSRIAARSAALDAWRADAIVEALVGTSDTATMTGP